MKRARPSSSHSEVVHEEHRTPSNDAHKRQRIQGAAAVRTLEDVSTSTTPASFDVRWCERALREKRGEHPSRLSSVTMIREAFERNMVRENDEVAHICSVLLEAMSERNASPLLVGMIITALQEIMEKHDVACSGQFVERLFKIVGKRSSDEAHGPAFAALYRLLRNGTLPSEAFDQDAIASVCLQAIACIVTTSPHVRMLAVKVIGEIERVRRKEMDTGSGPEGKEGGHDNMMIEEEEHGNDKELKQRQSTGGYDGMQVLMEVASHESDARLRSCAYEALVLVAAELRQHDAAEGNDPLSSIETSIFALAENGLRDSDPLVRVQAISLLWLVVRIAPTAAAPETASKLPHKNEFDLVKHRAFASICDLVNDESWKVRSTACSALALFSDVDRTLLLQTLSKKPVKYRSDGILRAVLSRLPVHGNAAGAFVHGMEDEMVQVRLSAVQSVHRLCEEDSTFALKALDFLVEMFNDEIEQVRLSAIEALQHVHFKLTFNESQIRTVLVALDAHSEEVRRGTLRLLSSCSFSSVMCMNVVLHALFRMIRCFPHDKSAVLECLSKLGTQPQHAAFIEMLVPSLLKLDRRFKPTEPSIGDEYYVAVLITIFNAAWTRRSILSVTPKFLERHFHSLVDLCPELLPRALYERVGLNEEEGLNGGNEMQIEESAESAPLQRLSKLLSSTCARIRENGRPSRAQSVRMLRPLATEVVRCGSSAGAHHHVQSKLLFSVSNCIALLSGLRSHDAASAARSLLFASYEVEALFSGMSANVLQWVRLLRAAAHMSWLCDKAKSGSAPGSREDGMDLLRRLDVYAAAVEEGTSGILDGTLQQSMRALANGKPGVSVEGVLIQLQNELTLNPLEWQSDWHGARFLSGSVIDVVGVDDRTEQRDGSHFIRSVPHQVVVHGVVTEPTTSTMCILVTYPDGSTEAVQLRSAAVFETASEATSFAIRIPLHSQHGNEWSDTAPIKVQVAVSVKPNVARELMLTKEHERQTQLYIPLCAAVEYRARAVSTLEGND